MTFHDPTLGGSAENQDTAIQDLYKHTTYVVVQDYTQIKQPKAGLMAWDSSRLGLFFCPDGINWYPFGYAAKGWVAIDHKALVADGAISFTSIPQVYTHLMLVGNVRTIRAVTLDEVRFRFNNDNSAIYDYVYSVDLNATVTGGNLLAQTQGAFGYAPGASATASVFGAFTATVPSYAGATYKSVISSGGSADNTAANTGLATIESKWRNTAAVTRIDLIDAAGNAANWKALSAVTLMALKAV